MPKRYPIGTIGYGGCRAVSADGRTSISGLTRAEVLAECALVVDLTAIPNDDLAILVVSGPMLDPSLPDGTLSKMFGDHVAFDPTPQPGRDPRLGNAHGLDNCALDVYLRLCDAFGAAFYRTTRPAELPA